MSAPQSDPEHRTLADWGEFKFINEALLPLLNRSNDAVLIGDDCAVLPVPGSEVKLVVTCDAAPRPLVCDIGIDDLSVWGWYSVTANASDLAAAGADPLAFASSVEAPPSTLVASFNSFFRGVVSACERCGLLNAGGNIRQAPRFECHGTAIGICPPSRRPLTRGGARAGDDIVAIGPLGTFICAYLNARDFGFDALSEPYRDALLRPNPKSREMVALADAGCLTAASDNSDSVLGAVFNIAERSRLTAVLELDEGLLSAEVVNTAGRLGLNPWNLAFFWGDWQVIATVASHEIDRFRAFAADHSIEFTPLGTLTAGEPRTLGRYKGSTYSMDVIRNENFTSRCYNAGFRNHVDYLLGARILGGPV
jgi:thiamine-monophosphate kinase